MKDFFGIYILLNFVMYFYIGIKLSPKIIEDGLRVKHLIVLILFLPASVAVLLAFLVFSIFKWIVSMVQSKRLKEFLNKKLF